MGKSMKKITDSLTEAATSVTSVLLIIGGAGALKEVLVASGVSQYIGNQLQPLALSPIFLVGA